VDPISHALLGRVLAKTRADVPPRGCVAAAVLGALSPDLDFALAPIGWDRYLAFHLTGTHTLVASPILALGTAGLVRLFVRNTAIRPLAVSAWFGVVIGHLAFDLVSGSDMELFAPFSSMRLALHLIGMADLLAVTVLLASTVAMRWRPRTAAAATLVILLTMLGVKAVSQRRALTLAHVSLAAAGLPAQLGHPEAVNGSLTRWQIFGRVGVTVRAWRIDAASGELRLDFSKDMASGPLVEASTRADAVRRFLAVADLPFATIETTTEGTLVVWSDIRYCDAVSCALTFGVAFDAAGTPLRQIIRIGPIEQTRPMTPK